MGCFQKVAKTNLPTSQFSRQTRWAIFCVELQHSSNPKMQNESKNFPLIWIDFVDNFFACTSVFFENWTMTKIENVDLDVAKFLKLKCTHIEQILHKQQNLRRMAKHVASKRLAEKPQFPTN